MMGSFCILQRSVSSSTYTCYENCQSSCRVGSRFQSRVFGDPSHEFGVKIHRLVPWRRKRYSDEKRLVLAVLRSEFKKGCSTVDRRTRNVSLGFCPNSRW